MSHLTLWMRPVGAGAGEHQEGQQGEVQQVSQEHLPKYTWHIKTVVSIMARSMGAYLRWKSTMP